MSGTINVSRCLWDDPAFQNEPFSEREAWVWMIAEASWKARERRVGKVIVRLERGQLSHSTRFLSDTWRWSHAKVRRFLDRLEGRNMLRRSTDTGVSVISITKYDTYQFSDKSSGTAAAQQRHSSGTNEKKWKEGEEGEREDTNVSLSLVSDEPCHANDISHAVQRYNDAARKAGWPEVQKNTPQRAKMLKARLKDAGGIEGWEAALCKAFDSDFCRGRTAKPWTGFGFDWLVKAGNFTKLMEGNYDNRSQHENRSSDRRPNGVDPALEQIARLAGLGGT